MLQVNELRIGNKVQLAEDGTAFTIDAIAESGLDVSSEVEVTWIETSQFGPLPIEEERLIAYGFIKCEGQHGVYYKHNQATLFRLWKNESGFWVVGRYDKLSESVQVVAWKKSDWPFHRLQNLFFELTDLELCQ